MGAAESVPELGSTEPGLTEPWLRGPLKDVHPLVMPVFFSFAQVREDLIEHVRGVSEENLWKNVRGTSLGFHLKHLAGSVDRLTTYLAGEQLAREQLAYLAAEFEPGPELASLLRLIDSALAKSEDQLRRLDPSSLYDRRSVGRRALPTTVIGLLIHLAEHTQRHLGQAIILTRMLR